MTKRLYKYIGSGNIPRVFSSKENITLKCSMPKDFNDPYELFLSTDFNIDPELLAAYAEAIGELPQLPTTCFSTSPVVVPMWAHYAENHQGFVVEFSEEEIERALPSSRIGSVRYSDEPLDDFSDLIARVVHIAKPRYTYFLQSAIFSAAYFTKMSCWSYEQERRLIVPLSVVREPDHLMLLDLPAAAVTNIICGARASSETKTQLRQISNELSCGYYELRIGRSSAIPFLARDDHGPSAFNGSGIAASTFSCQECLEPLMSQQERCSWCQIDDDMRAYAASRKAFRILDHYGALEGYIRGMDALSGGRQRKGSGDP